MNDNIEKVARADKSLGEIIDDGLGKEKLTPEKKASFIKKHRDTLVMLFGTAVVAASLNACTPTTTEGSVKSSGTTVVEAEGPNFEIGKEKIPLPPELKQLLREKMVILEKKTLVLRDINGFNGELKVYLTMKKGFNYKTNYVPNNDGSVSVEKIVNRKYPITPEEVGESMALAFWFAKNGNIGSNDPEYKYRKSVEACGEDGYYAILIESGYFDYLNIDFSRYNVRGSCPAAFDF